MISDETPDKSARSFRLADSPLRKVDKPVLKQKLQVTKHLRNTNYDPSKHISSNWDFLNHLNVKE